VVLEHSCVPAELLMVIVASKPAVASVPMVACSASPTTGVKVHWSTCVPLVIDPLTVWPLAIDPVAVSG
jgi:hypothetical protein